MHCHTSEYSTCSHIDAVTLIRRVYEKGLEGVILTDHHFLWTPEQLEQLRRHVGVPETFLILAGQEVTTSDAGHVLVYGATGMIQENTPLSEIRKEFPQAAVVWAHPYRNGHIPSPKRLLDPMFDGVEIFSSNHTIEELHRALQDWHEYKFVAIGGTDTHSKSYVGMYPTIFDHPVATMEELVTELKAGRCRPFFKEIPRSGTTDAHVLELTMGTKGKDDRRERLVIKRFGSPDSWKSGARTFHIMKEIARTCFQNDPHFRMPRPLVQDSSKMVLIEEGIRGKPLFERLLRANPENARLYVQMAAEWVAKLHNCRLQVTPPEEFMQKEPKRLGHYVSILYRINHRHAQRVQDIADSVIQLERDLYLGHPERFVQAHGDYHPQNIFIGQDNPDDNETLYIAALDFDSSYAMPPAFDVGTFVAQFRNQFFHYRDVGKKVNEDFFLGTYRQYAETTDDDFLAQVELFRARTSLSIIYFLIKVGLGDSEDLWRVMVEAEYSLTNLSVSGSGRE
jgi:predicted metal-dependent phosphoesterase TrpH/thiamine kinase-like enzyme